MSARDKVSMSTQLSETSYIPGPCNTLAQCNKEVYVVHFRVHSLVQRDGQHDQGESAGS